MCNMHKKLARFCIYVNYVTKLKKPLDNCKSICYNTKARQREESLKAEEPAKRNCKELFKKLKNFSKRY